MKRDKENVQEILDRALTRHRDLSRTDVETAMARAWQSLGPKMDSADEWKIAPWRPPRRSAFAVRFAAVAAILLVSFVAFVMTREPTNSTSPVVGIGDVVRSTGKDNRIVSLADGSQIEMRPGTEFTVERANDGIRIRLSSGSVIVHATEQRSGHLYVQTKDVTVSVVGTVFFVKAEEGGSRVAVIEGEVRVQQGSTTTNLVRGQQFATSSTIPAHPVVEEVAWSRTAEIQVAALQQPPAPAATPRKPLEFETASIRPVSGQEARDALGPISAPGQPFGDEYEVRCKGIDGAFSTGDRARQAMSAASNIGLGRCVGVVTLSHFVRIVRDVEHPGVTKTQWNTANDLDWLPDGTTRQYLVNAKAEDPGKATKADLQEMLKNLAFDRIKLKYHLETRIADGWAVRIAPGGLKMKESTSRSAEESLRIKNEGGTTQRRQTIQSFFSGMAPMTGQLISHGPVIDLTGLTGKVFEFTWNPRIIPPLPGGTGGGRGGGVTVNGANIPVPDYDPPLERQIEQQLGLTIAKDKVPVSVLVVDHAEAPSEN
jgi:uncharacterized protein (TIGR03435 family)